MKTINWLGFNYKVHHRQQDSENNQSSVRTTIAKLGKKIAKSLHNLCDRLLKFATNSEPQIWEKQDRFGNTYFRIYDPIGDRQLNIF